MSDAKSGGELDERTAVALAGNALAVAACGTVWAMAQRPGAEPLKPIVVVLGVASSELGLFGRRYLANWLAPRSLEAATAVDRIWRRIAEEFHYTPAFLAPKPDPQKVRDVALELIKVLGKCWPSPPKLHTLILKTSNIPRELARFVADKLAGVSPMFRPGGAGELGHRFAIQAITAVMEQALREQTHFEKVQPYDLFKDLNITLVLPPAIFAADQADTVEPAIGKLAPYLNAIGLDYGTKFNGAVKLNAQGLRKADEGKLDEAEEDFRRAAALVEEIGDSGELANAIVNLGAIEVSRGNFDAAAAQFTKAIALFERRGLTSRTAGVLKRLGSTEIKRSNVAAAETHLKKALALLEEGGDRSDVADLYDALAGLEEQRESFPAAAVYVRKALAVQGEDESAVDRLMRLGLISYQYLNFGAAAAAYTKSLALAEKFGDKRGQAFACYALAVLEQTRENKRDSCRWLKRAHDLYIEIGDQEEAKKSADLLKKSGCT